MDIGLALFSQLLELGVGWVRRDHEVDELNPHLVRAGLAR